MSSKPKPTAGIGDQALKKATGRSWNQWFDILDSAGAMTLPHSKIAELLHREHDCGDWWSQMVTVGYEQARGLRKKHQVPGGYSISKSKTIAAPVAKLFSAWKLAKKRQSWLDDASFTIRKSTPNKTLRIAWGDGETRVEVMFYPKDASKTQVVVQHSKLADAKAALRMKSYWGKTLDRLSAEFA